MLQFESGGTRLTVLLSRYANGNLAVEAVEPGGMSYAVLSVNMPPYDALPDGIFYLKAWSENAQVAADFVNSGLVEMADPVVHPPRQSGFVTARAYRFVE